VVLKVRAVPYDRRMLATAYSRVQFGRHSPPVSIDVQVMPGLPSLSVVELAQAAVKEAKDRVRSAVTSCGFHRPPGRVGCITISRAARQRKPGKSV